MSKRDVFPPPDPVTPPPDGHVPGARGRWSVGGGFKDSTNYRRHKTVAKGGPIERRKATPEELERFERP